MGDFLRAVVFCGGLAAGIALCDAVAALPVWLVLSRGPARPPFARFAGAVVGAVLGAWASERQLEFALDLIGITSEAAQLTIMLAYPFSVAFTTAIAAWLLAEVAGGKSTHPWLSGLLGCACALAASLAFYAPVFFVSGLSEILSSFMPQWLQIAAYWGVVVLGSLLGVSPGARRSQPKVDRPAVAERLAPS